MEFIHAILCRIGFHNWVFTMEYPAQCKNCGISMASYETDVKFKKTELPK